MSQGEVTGRGLAKEALLGHWMMDELAAETLAASIDRPEIEKIVSLNGVMNPSAITNLEKHRRSLADIFNGATDLKVAIVGPCSFDASTRAEDIGEMVATLQQRNPKTLVAARINGAKPRTRGGWTGSAASLAESDRLHLLASMIALNQAGVPVVSEITEPMQFGSFGPMLSGMWIGARDIESTSLRSMASITRLPVMFKNGRDGSPKTVGNAINAVAMSSADTGCGVDIGTIARLASDRVVPTGHLPVGQGNLNVGIIARGHELDEDLPARARLAAAISHLCSLCTLAAARNTGVIIDGSHDVPQMLEIPRSESDRFPQVMSILLDAIEKGDVDNSQTIKGVMCEVGTNTGRTDPNWIINDKSMSQLSEILSRVEEL